MPPADPQPPELDVLVAGDGPVGMLLGTALAGSELRWRVVGPAETGAERPLALARGSQLLLERIGILGDIETTPIRSVHVSQRGAFGRTRIDAVDQGLPELGGVASYRSLCEALRSALDARAPGARLPGRVTAWSETDQAVEVKCSIRDPQAQGLPEAPRSLRARLLVLAEGSPAAAEDPAGRSVRDYGQCAVVAQVSAQLPHRNVAYERFTACGPLALLPFGDRCALIWSTAPEQARTLCAIDEGEFLARLGAAFGRRLGRFTAAGPRSSFALALQYRRGGAGKRVVPIGNAAQTLHPVAGQGLNLGIRDAWELAQLLRASSPQEIAGADFARRFARHRLLDRRAGIAFTDTLARVFSGEAVMPGAARAAALLAFDLLPPARNLLARRTMFGVNR